MIGRSSLGRAAAALAAGAVVAAAVAAVVVAATPARAAETKLGWQAGPKSVPLAGQAVLELPKGYLFLGAEETRAVLRKMGNSPSDATIGLVISEDEKANWFLVVSYHDAGYIRDDEARSWDTAAMLASMQEGTAEDNARRREMKISELILTGWAEKPHYDEKTNKVLWAVSNKTSDPHEAPGVNFNTLALGRHGYISLNLVTDLADLPARRAEVQPLIAGLSFVEGKRYADFDHTTDKVAAVGLTALVAGTAAKLGFFGKLWALIVPILLAAKKLVVVALVGAAAVIGKLFKGRNRGGTDPVEPA